MKILLIVSMLFLTGCCGFPPTLYCSPDGHPISKDEYMKQ